MMSAWWRITGLLSSSFQSASEDCRIRRARRRRSCPPPPCPERPRQRRYRFGPARCSPRHRYRTVSRYRWGPACCCSPVAPWPSMEGGSIIEPHLGELEEVLDVTRCVVRVEPNLDLAERRRNGDARIDFLKLHSHPINSASIVHERFCCIRRSPATTNHRPAGSPLGSPPYCTSTHRGLMALRAGLATGPSDFSTNRHESCGLDVRGRKPYSSMQRGSLHERTCKSYQQPQGVMGGLTVYV